ncbi:DUF4296 domain-containing protein [Sinomicrobium sp.]
MKLAYRILFLTVFVVVSSCKESAVDKPDNLIPEDQMKDIFFDLALLNAARTVDPATLRKNHIVSEEYIYHKHAIDSIQFVESNLYYASMPNRYDSMYKEVEERLKRMEEEEKEAQIEREKEKREKEKAKARAKDGEGIEESEEAQRETEE